MSAHKYIITHISPHCNCFLVRPRGQNVVVYAGTAEDAYSLVKKDDADTTRSGKGLDFVISAVYKVDEGILFCSKEDIRFS